MNKYSFFKNKYQWEYQKVRIRRYIILTLLVFFFQCLCTVNLTFNDSLSGHGPFSQSFVPLPLYPPIGISMIAFYLWGSNVVLGLLIAGGLAYTLKGFALLPIVLFLGADIGVAFLSAYLSRSVFSADIKPLANGKETWRFFKINALLTLLISAPLRTVALAINSPEIVKTSPEIVKTGPEIIKNSPEIIKIMVLFWLGDLNAILILFSFVLSWVYVPLSREKISDKHLHLIRYKIIFALVGIYLIVCLNLLHNIYNIYLIAGLMLVSLWMMRFFGQLIGSLLMFVSACLYLGYFIIFGGHYLNAFGYNLYLFIPATLLLYWGLVFWVGKD